MNKENDKKKAKSIDSLKIGMNNWGTVLDKSNIKDVPSMYAGKTFSEAWHDDIDNFSQMSDKEKWEMAYWVEYQTGRKNFTYGFFVGVILSAFVIALLLGT